MNVLQQRQFIWTYFWTGVQAAYWAMLEEGRINQATANILMRSVDEAMDLVSRQPLCDWKGLKSNVQFPSYYRFLQMSRLPRKLVTYFTVERLESDVTSVLHFFVLIELLGGSYMIFSVIYCELLICSFIQITSCFFFSNTQESCASIY